MYDPLIIGKIQIHFPELDSTNQYALSLISKSKPLEGTVISTSNQFQGRGQIGRLWLTNSFKNITLSIIVKPQFLDIKDQFFLNMIFALSVRKMIEEVLQMKTQIKWPNDIYLNDKKIAGILIQNVLSGSNYSYAVLGVGINVNQTLFESSIPNPTSMFLESGTRFSLKELKKRLFLILDPYYKKLQSKPFNEIHKEYVSYLYRYQEESRFLINQDQKEAKIVNVESDGHLVLRFPDDTEGRFNLNELKYII